MNIPKAITTQTLNSMFHYLDGRSDTVFWIRSLDYQKQIYLSASYESIWDQPCSTLYDNPTSWSQTVLQDDLLNINSFVDSRFAQPAHASGLVYYRVPRQNNDTIFVRDHNFDITNHQNQTIAVAGLAVAIPERQWSEEHCFHTYDNDTTLSNNLSLIRQRIDESLSSYSMLTTNKKQKKTSSYSIMLSEETIINFTKREAECIRLLFSGMSGKQTAKALQISPVTVEDYISKIKFKLGCHSRFQIISKLQYFNNVIAQWHFQTVK